MSGSNFVVTALPRKNVSPIPTHPKTKHCNPSRSTQAQTRLTYHEAVKTNRCTQNTDSEDEGLVVRKQLLGRPCVGSDRPAPDPFSS
jgi:hypothetical protein